LGITLRPEVALHFVGACKKEVMMPKSIDEMVRIWKSLRETGEYEGITISRDIRNSWERSAHYGVDPYKKCCDVVLTQSELRKRRTVSRSLLEQATVMMANLKKFTEGSGFIFTLADNQGYILARSGDDESLNYADHAKLIEGANWSERVMGTTSGSVAGYTGEPVQLIGYEYYCLFTRFSISSSSPIFDPEGFIIGMLNVTGPYHPVNRHTMGMVVAAARALEKQIALKTALQQSEMNNLYKTAIMDSMSDGVITLDRKGRVIHMNALAAQNLGIENQCVVDHKLQDLMSPNNEPFFSAISDNKQLNKPLEIRRRYDSVKLTVSCTPLTGRNGKLLGTVVILQPIQKYKRLIEKVSGTRAKITFDDIIGQSREFGFSLKLAKIAAKSDSNVLLLGESGVGKEMFAQAIHNASDRCLEPFFAINCAALPRELISSELFGYEEGAFTGARKGGNPGKFELADQGTLFLDEIGEMPLDMQGTLLRFLEEGKVMRLGGLETIPVNVRIIAASNKNLMEEVKKGRFRLDLYYRLKVIDIDIPSLRERRDDIPMLVKHFIKIIGPRLGKNISAIDDEAMDVLLAYDWPGNVRELNNAIERAINLAGGNVLTKQTLPYEIKTGNDESLPPWGKSLHKNIVEERLIRSCLQKYQGNRNLAAK
jgi:PAS domain S-box-containing protein